MSAMTGVFRHWRVAGYGGEQWELWERREHRRELKAE
jgi:GH24 family phage-related lysozyme (muramidase)